MGLYGTAPALWLQRNQGARAIGTSIEYQHTTRPGDAGHLSEEAGEVCVVKCQPKRGDRIERPIDEWQLEGVTDGDRHRRGGARGADHMPGHVEGDDIVPASTQRPAEPPGATGEVKHAPACREHAQGQRQLTSGDTLTASAAKTLRFV
jgi:hypothetical protein